MVSPDRAAVSIALPGAGQDPNEQDSDIENMIVHKPDPIISIPIEAVARAYRKTAEAGIKWTSARYCWPPARIMLAS